MKQIVSLGSNCAVCYHLVNLGLRTHAYPFDWTKLSIGNLNQVLSTQFAGFAELEIKKFSPAHPAIGQDLASSTKSSGSLVLVNKLNIQFAHEITTSNELESFKAGMSRRIERFGNLTNPTFVRLETGNLSATQMSHYDRLVQLLDQMFPTYKLIVISHSKPPNNKIIWVELKSFDSDWRYPGVDWAGIFNL